MVSGEKHIEWDMYNDNASGIPVELTVIDLAWPSANGDLTHIKVGGAVIWDPDEDGPPIVPPLTVSAWLPDQVLPTKLHFHFINEVDSSLYSGSITFDGCTPKPFSHSD